MDWYELPSYSTGKGPFHAAVIVSGAILFGSIIAQGIGAAK